VSSIQFACHEEKDQLLALYGACFPQDDPSFWEWIFRRVYAPKNTLVIRENDRITASLQMIPCEMQLGLHRFRAHYIYAAATLPEQQGRGLMGKLLAQAEEEGRRRGQAFSVLITQEDSLLDYYSRFGYQGRFRVAVMPPATGALSVEHRCRMAVPADIDALTGLYQQATHDMLCGVRRDDFWQLQLELFGQGAWVLEKQGEITAYAFADERGIMEAAGPEANLLAAHLTPGQAWRTLPGNEGQPMGSIKALHKDYQQIMEQNPCYLNLMYN